MAKSSAYKRIQEISKMRNDSVLRCVWDCNRRGEGYRPEICGVSWRNSLNRLENMGKLEHRVSTNYLKSGYWVIK